MSALLRSWAQALGGEVAGCGVICPSPGHSAKDRSLSVTPSATSPSGFLVHSFTGADSIVCLDYVRAKLGLPPFAAPQKPAPDARHGASGSRDSDEPANAAAAADNARKATWLWSIREPVSESNAAGLYLRKRGFADAFPATLGYLPPNGKHPPAMIAAFGFCGERGPGVIAPAP